MTLVNKRIGILPKGRQKIGILIGTKAGNIELRNYDLSGNFRLEIQRWDPTRP